MARRAPRAQRFETRSARAALTPRPKPYRVATLARGVTLLYRRNKKPPHPWIVKVSDGHGGHWTSRVADADDHQDANGEGILDYRGAIPAALKLAHGTADTGKPVTVADALDAYQRDLIARGQSPANASVVRFHLTPTLASTPVAVLTARVLAGWRDVLLANGMKPATLVRICRSFKAALNLSSRVDVRIVNGNAWRNGLSGISEDFSSRNVQRLDDDQIRTLIAAAYEIDHQFGLYVEVAAIAGARISQIVRLNVGDLQTENGGGPRLLMPSSKKGRGRKPGKYPVPITESLAARLKMAAGNRAPNELLLVRSDGQAWRPSSNDHARFYQQAAERAGITGTTITALRHSSITRALLRNIPVRVVASGHDTSVVMIEKTYSAFISNFADSMMRVALLEPDAPPAGDNVTPLPGR